MSSANRATIREKTTEELHALGWGVRPSTWVMEAIAGDGDRQIPTALGPTDRDRRDALLGPDLR